MGVGVGGIVLTANSNVCEAESQWGEEVCDLLCVQPTARGFKSSSLQSAEEKVCSKGRQWKVWKL